MLETNQFKERLGLLNAPAYLGTVLLTVRRGYEYSLAVNAIHDFAR